MNKQIISFSRRTDGPAFYMDKFQDAIEKEYINVQNPYNKKVYTVSLKPNDIAGFVLWSKNFKPFLNKWEILLNYSQNTLFSSQRIIPVYFQFTRNSVDRILEPNTPSLQESISQLKEMIEISSPDHIMWRFDPIVFYRSNNILLNNLKDFKEIVYQFSNFGITKCTISFATYYRKVENRFKRFSLNYYKISDKEMKKITEELVKIAKKYNITLFACCNPNLLKIDGIQQAHCVDGNFLSKLWNIPLSTAKDPGQREYCGCTKSKDIGGYGKDWICYHSCLYCYANPNNRTKRNLDFK
ncbi:MAG: DUF1848 family protein [Candidatus Lokiarchaeota archaeon]|nr:DUF1848 family protein [Candidatus Lokiarchaeota archaeon]